MKKKWMSKISLCLAVLMMVGAVPVSATESSGIPTAGQEAGTQTSAAPEAGTADTQTPDTEATDAQTPDTQQPGNATLESGAQQEAAPPPNIQGEQMPESNIQGEQVPEANVQGEQVPQTDGDKVTIEEHDRPYLALGADLSDEQRATVLGLMGIDPAGLADYDVVNVSNQEEHQYLGAYIDASKIGSKSWSSVVIVEREAGSGLNISTSNITYCTVGMYKNALTTAGITDADIIVAGPKPISGTAALVGIFKAYEEMTGEEVGDNVIDAALNELVVTGELEAAIEGLTNEEVEEFIAYIKSVIAQNDLTDADSINAVIDEACEKYGVTLSDAERQKIVDLLLKITSLGIDLSGLVDYAESLYNSFKNGGSGDGIFQAIGDFFVNAFQAIADFFKGLFS